MELDVEVPASARQRGVVGRFEIDGHQGEDRPQEALRLTQGQPEDEPERQRRLDRKIRKPLLPTGLTGRRRSPPLAGGTPATKTGKGVGGVGTAVYQAVAFARDPDRLAWFQRAAQVLAGISATYGIEEACSSGRVGLAVVVGDPDTASLTPVAAGDTNGLIRSLWPWARCAFWKGGGVSKVSVVGLVTSLVLSVGSATAQPPESAPLAAQLSELMTNGQLEAVAGKDTVDDDRYVAALAFPGQLLVVSARYEVPIYIEEKIANGQFREVYLDLNQASMAGTKVQITDVGANGLLADDAGVDMVDGGSGVLRLDGGGPQMSGDEYRSAVADADQQYARMLSALIASAP